MLRKKMSFSPNFKVILKIGEDYKTEFKERIDASLDKTIVALANSSGGKIYIGVTDRGKIKGIDITNTNELKSKVESIARNCDPKISISTQVLKKEKIFVIEVPESKDKPHKCSTGFYIRSGASSQKLSRDEILDFAETEDLLKFDTLPCKKFIFKKDFDKEKLFNFMDRTGLKYNKKNYLQILENLKVIKRQGSKTIMNNAGALFFSKNLERIFFHTEIACGLFKGTDKVYVIDSARYNTDLITNIEEAMKFLWKNLRARHELIYKSARRKNVLEIPDKALREALINAVTHRNYTNQGPFIQVEIYDDRVEISNFGGLPKGLERSEFGRRSVPRNRLIASLMRRVQYIEEMGTGIEKMRKLVKKEGLPPIKFEFTNFTTVTFYRKPLLKKSILKSTAIIPPEILAQRLSNILKINSKNPDIFLKILNHIESDIFLKSSFSESHKVALRTLERHLKTLKQHELISFEGHPKTGRYVVTKKYEELKNSV